MGARIVDDFLPNFRELRELCDGLDYSGVTNPDDGVDYPGISLEVPDEVIAYTVDKLSGILGARLGSPKMFFRLTTEGTDAPHQSHNDQIMGDVTFILYMNRPEDCRGGTAFVEHVEVDFSDGVLTFEQEEVWRRDTNNQSMWRIVGGVYMYPNRAAVYDSKIMHRAEPVGGFGTGKEDGRLVLCGFFSYD